MGKIYATIQGETWDQIAFKVYGNEKYADFLMANNYRHLDVLVFSSGTVLDVPALPAEEKEGLPPWRSPGEATADPYDNYDGEEEGRWGRRGRQA